MAGAAIIFYFKRLTVERDTEAFIIRIWREARDGAGNIEWRGFIDHVGTHQRLYFADLNGIIRFIQEQTGANRAPSTLWRWPFFTRIRHEIDNLRGKLFP